MAKPTQRDVAKAANVSQGLVSLALNDSGAEIAEATRIRIREAARRLGYVPKSKHIYEPKGAVPGKRGKLLAYIPQTVTRELLLDHSIYDAYEEFYARFQNRLTEAAAQSGVQLIIRPYDNPMELTSWLIEWGVDGVILHSSDQSLSEWISKRYPMVQLSRRNVAEADVVMSDQKELMTIALDYLRQHGHERIAFLAPALESEIYQQRRRTYLDYTQKAKLPAYPEFLSCEQIEEDFSKLLKNGKDRPTAVIAGDPVALMLQKQAIKQGLSLPEDLSMIGIDNISADHFAMPPLTSIDVRADEITRIALSLLTQRLTDPTRAFQKIEITPKLIARESVAALPKATPAEPSLPHSSDTSLHA